MSEMEKDRNTGGLGYYIQRGGIALSFSFIFDAREALRGYFTWHITRDGD